jgi:hypothetical protein
MKSLGQTSFKRREISHVDYIFTGHYATAKLGRLVGCITIWDLVLAQAPDVEFLSKGCKSRLTARASMSQ